MSTRQNMKFLVLVLTVSIYGFMMFVSSICSAASYPQSTATPLVADLSMNQYKLTDAGDIITKGPWVDVRAFGAVGDGVTDDTTAIQSAIDSLPGGGIVFLPAGTYKTSSTLTVFTRITLQGVGPSTINYTGAGTAIQSKPGLERYRINLRDFNILTTTAACALDFSTANESIVENLSIYGGPQTGILLGAPLNIGNYHNTFINLHIENCSVQSVQIGGADGANVNSFYGGVFFNSPIHFNIEKGSTNQIVGAFLASSATDTSVVVKWGDDNLFQQVYCQGANKGFVFNNMASYNLVLACHYDGVTTNFEDNTSSKNNSEINTRHFDFGQKFGIGVENPTEKLDVQYAGAFRGNVSAYLGSKGTFIGYNTASDYGFIQSADFGNTHKPLYLQGWAVSLYGGLDGNVLGLHVDNSARVGIGTATPASSAKLEISSTTGALLLPRMTTTQRDALTAVNGMIIYNTTNNRIEAYENGVWIDL